MAGKGKRGEMRGKESIKELLQRVKASELRAFLVRVASNDEKFERELREEFERELREEFEQTDADQAAIEIENVTTSLLDEYEWDGYIDWHTSAIFQIEYKDAVRAIVRPFLLREDAEALACLVIPRLVQLQEICIDESEDLYIYEFGEIAEQLDRTFELADEVLRSRLFVMLANFLKVNPGNDYANIYETEQNFVREFLGASFAKDPAFASKVIEFADEQIDGLLDTANDEQDYGEYERGRWAQLRLVAMVTRGDTPDEVRSYAEKFELLDVADVVRTVADAYVSAKAPREAAAILRENLRAHSQEHEYGSTQPIRIVDYLEKLALECYNKAELAELYRRLLAYDRGNPFCWGASIEDQIRWYDGLSSATDDAAWTRVRAEVLESIPYSTANELLAHEGAREELYQHIMANGGKDLLAYERVLSGAHPKVYVDYYLKNAKASMSTANKRNAYRNVARQLAKAARLTGGREVAEALAREYAARYPKRSALLDELRKAGFEV